MEELWHFVSVLETETNTSFSIETCRVPGDSEVVLRLNCHAGGKESWVVRKSRKEQECTQRPNATGQSRKGRCTAHIKIRVPLSMAQEAGYATQHGTTPTPTPPPPDGLGAAPSPSPSPGPPPPPPPSEILLALHLHHEGHEPGSRRDVAELPMDPRIRDFIKNHALQNIPARHMQTIVRDCGQKLVEEDGQPNVDPCNTRYFPTYRAINNQVRKALLHIQLHKVDQEAVSRWVEERKAAGDSCYFRPHMDGSSKLLLVHQTPHQLRMLKLYGNTIVGMDATYKTNKHGFPLFIISVVDNHGHGYPVGIFVVEDEAQQPWVVQ